ncbi:MAG: LD-carboxypeptidase [Patescibacteria group bacterium]
MSAGNAEVRSQIFNEAISDDTIKMIWLSPGGSSCSEILDKINYDSFQSNPKIII